MDMCSPYERLGDAEEAVELPLVLGGHNLLRGHALQVSVGQLPESARSASDVRSRPCRGTTVCEPWLLGELLRDLPDRLGQVVVVEVLAQLLTDRSAEGVGVEQ